MRLELGAHQHAGRRMKPLEVKCQRASCVLDSQQPGLEGNDEALLVIWCKCLQVRHHRSVEIRSAPKEMVQFFGRRELPMHGLREYVVCLSASYRIE